MVDRVDYNGGSKRIAGKERSLSRSNSGNKTPTPQAQNLNTTKDDRFSWLQSNVGLVGLNLQILEPSLCEACLCLPNYLNANSRVSRGVKEWNQGLLLFKYIGIIKGC